jgi:hypothetical protein
VLGNAEVHFALGTIELRVGFEDIQCRIDGLGAGGSAGALIEPIDQPLLNCLERIAQVSR